MDFNRLTKAKQKIGITYELKPEQITALCAFMESKDIVCLFPTGFGKSIIFQMMPFLSDDPMSCVLVISPLNAIMKDHVRKLCGNGISACFLDSTGRDGSTYTLKPTLGTDLLFLTTDDVLINVQTRYQNSHVFKSTCSLYINMY